MGAGRAHLPGVEVGQGRSWNALGPEGVMGCADRNFGREVCVHDRNAGDERVLSELERCEFGTLEVVDIRGGDGVEVRPRHDAAPTTELAPLQALLSKPPRRK